MTSPGTAGFRPGEMIVRREVLHDQLWMEHPVRVVDASSDEFAVLLEPGSTFSFHPHPQGTHPWSHQSQWQGPQVLQIYRPNLWYSVWMFFDHGRFLNWYVNFEAPVISRPGSFDTDDYGLDLVIEPDGATRWKDVDHLDRMVANGRLDAQQVLGILTAAREVWDLVSADNRWWSRWENWRPPQQSH